MTWHCETRNLQGGHGVWFLWAIYCCVCSQTLKVISLSSDNPLQVVNDLVIAFGSEMGMCLHHLLAIGPHLVGTPEISLYTVSVFVNAYVHQSYWNRGFDFLLSFILSSFYTFSSLSSSELPELWLEAFDRVNSFRDKCSKVSHSLFNVFLWDSVWVPICCRSKLLWQFLRKPLNFEYCRFSFRIILLV